MLVGDDAPTTLDRRLPDAVVAPTRAPRRPFLPGEAKESSCPEIPSCLAITPRRWRSSAPRSSARSYAASSTAASSARRCAAGGSASGRRAARRRGSYSGRRSSAGTTPTARGGLEALAPAPRADRGRARELTDEQRELLLDIRREHPTRVGAADPADAGRRRPPRRRARVGDRPCGGSTASAGSTAARAARRHEPRLRWQADRPGALWHGDVCHGPALEHRRQDASRCASTRCSTTPRATSWRSRRITPSARVDMLGAVRPRAASRTARPRRCISTTARPTAASVCASRARGSASRCSTPSPTTPPARGKMERFWRTLRERLPRPPRHGRARCTTSTCGCWRFVDQHYHDGAARRAAWARRPPRCDAAAREQPRALDEAKLRDALTVRARRRVRARRARCRVDGGDCELDAGLPRRPHRHRRPLPARPDRAAVGRARGPALSRCTRRPGQRNGATRRAPAPTNPTTRHAPSTRRRAARPRRRPPRASEEDDR